jgi:3-hydroxymyristoyl/3-hydroxydecanoyl-(acyl carrier protein) dehydratase
MNWLASLPHQIPFRAASDARPIDDKTIEGDFVCTANDALMPGELSLDIMLVEAMAQCAGGVAFRDRPGHAYLSGIDHFETDRPVEPGDFVTIRATLDAEFGALYRFSATATAAGLEFARARFYLATPPEEPNANP